MPGQDAGEEVVPVSAADMEHADSRPRWCWGQGDDGGGLQEVLGQGEGEGKGKWPCSGWGIGAQSTLVLVAG